MAFIRRQCARKEMVMLILLVTLINCFLKFSPQKGEGLCLSLMEIVQCVSFMNFFPWKREAVPVTCRTGSVCSE